MVFDRGSLVEKNEAKITGSHPVHILKPHLSIFAFLYWIYSFIHFESCYKMNVLVIAELKMN